VKSGGTQNNASTSGAGKKIGAKGSGKPLLKNCGAIFSYAEWMILK
jgi:hypothetical protein